MSYVRTSLTTLAVLAMIVGATGALAYEPAASDPGIVDTQIVLGQSPRGYDIGFTRWYNETLARRSMWGAGWSVGVGAVIMHRDDPTPRTLLTDALGTVEKMNTQDLKQGWGGGPRFEITKQLGYDLEFEVELYNIDGWSNEASAQDAMPYQASNFWDRFLFDEVTTYYSSELFNLELNLRWPLFGKDWLKAVAGFRYINMGERFSANVTYTPPIPIPLTLHNSGEMILDNNLYGIQFGIEPVLWNPCGPIRLDGYLKTGIFGNDVKYLLTSQGDLDNRQYRKRGGRASFGGGLGLFATYSPCCCCCCCGKDPCRCGEAECCDTGTCGTGGCGTGGCGTGTCAVRAPWRVFVGYEALWLSDVAVVEEQLFKTDDGFQIGYGDAFYHGVVIGLAVDLGPRCYCR